ncbi:MAG: hypothetical protein AAB534_02610 [Patescibacteria group bacterium]
MEIKILIIGWILGIVSTLGATWLQAYLTRKQSRSQTLMETRLSTYAKLLSVAKSEERYPPNARAGMTTVEVDAYNAKVSEWRRNRKAMKGIATEAFLLAGNSDLQEKLSEFISSDNPDFRITDVEILMRTEIGIK